MNRELSDIDIVVHVTQTYGSAVAEPADAAPPAKRTRSNKDAAHGASQLAVLPGHRIVLFNSGFFKAQQAQHWQTPLTPPTSKRQKREGSEAAGERPSGT
ncbi:hypothetical protein OEZ86_006218 [Tetradesmus obliquus]|nr:hypothetical protein OEZ86_006218 [Tetradesmus obliquus]